MDISSLIDRLERHIMDAANAHTEMQGDYATRREWEDIRHRILSDFTRTDAVFGWRGRVRLMKIGELAGRDIIVRGQTLRRIAYLGKDGRIYIYGPRKKRQQYVTDLHPYSPGDVLPLPGDKAIRLPDIVKAARTAGL